MKKALLSLCAMTLAATASADLIYSWESNEGEVTEIGGTIEYVNGEGNRLNYVNGFNASDEKFWTICLNGKYGNLNDAAASANAGHMVITFDQELKAGDEIGVMAYKNKGDETKKSSIYFLYENGTVVKGGDDFNDICEVTGKDENNKDITKYNGKDIKLVTYTVPAEADGSKTLTLTRNDASTNLFITKLYIMGERQNAGTPWDIEGVTMNWMGESIAAGAEVDCLSYMYNIATDKEIAAGNGHIEFFDAAGNGIGVGALNAEAKMISFYEFGQTGYTTPGTYTLKVPAGAIVDAEGNPNAEYTATWTVKEQPAKTPWAIENITMQWMGEQIEAGSEVDALSTYFKVSPDGKAVGIGEGRIEFLNAAGQGIAVASNVFYGYIQFSGFGEGYTTPGTYTLNIPAGAIVDAEGNPCEAYTATWTVKEQPAVTPWAIEGVTMSWMGQNIAPESEVEALSYMYEVPGAMGFGEGHVEFLDAEGNGIAVANDINYGYLRFDSFGQTGYTTPGTYTLNIPAGALVDAEGNPCEAYTATWTVKEQPAKTPWAISEVVMQWMGQEIAAGSEVWTLSYNYVIKGEKTAMSFGEGHVEFLDAQGNGVQVASAITYGYLRFPFGEYGYNVAGTYTLNIPAGALVDEEGNPCEAFTATWTVKDQPTLGSWESWTFNVDEDPFFGCPTMGDLEANGLWLRFPEQENIIPDMTAKVEYTVTTFNAGGEMMPLDEDDTNASNDDEDIDPAFGVEEEVFTAYGDALFGDLSVNLVDGILHIMECGPGAYVINVSKVEVFDAEQVAVYTWTPNEEEGELVATTIDVKENEPVDDPTAIQNIAAEKAAKMFNLQGQRVNAAKGMVIVNGKANFVK